MAGKYTSIDPFKLGGTVVIWVYIQMIAEVLQMAAYGYAMTPSGSAIVADGFAAADVPISLTALLYVVVYLIGGFLGLKWIYRVNRNAHSFVRGLTNTPPWAIAWFFVPIAALWKPYEALSEAWQASERPQRWRTAPKPAFLPWWWGAWLIASFVGNGVAVATWNIPDTKVVAQLMILSAVPTLVADVLFIRLVKGLSNLQRTQINFGIFDEEGPAPKEQVPVGVAASASTAPPIVT